MDQALVALVEQVLSARLVVLVPMELEMLVVVVQITKAGRVVTVYGVAAGPVDITPLPGILIMVAAAGASKSNPAVSMAVPRMVVMVVQ